MVLLKSPMLAASMACHAGRLVTRVIAVSLGRAAVAIEVVTFGGRESNVCFPGEATFNTPKPRTSRGAEESGFES